MSQASQAQKLVVFQCGNCREVVSDSTFLVRPDNTRSTLSFTACCHVNLSTEFETSTNDDTIGSTFLPITCARCNSRLGRMYKTTAVHLDAVRDLYTLDASNLRSYLVGSCESSRDQFDFQAFQLNVEDLAKSDEKIMKVLLVFQERISALENEMAQWQEEKERDNLHVGKDSVFMQTDTSAAKPSPRKRAAKGGAAATAKQRAAAAAAASSSEPPESRSEADSAGKRKRLPATGAAAMEVEDELEEEEEEDADEPEFQPQSKIKKANSEKSQRGRGRGRGRGRARGRRGPGRPPKNQSRVLS